MNRTTKQQIIDGTRGTQTGAILACALGVELPAPRFFGKATVTSDGYVMCGFVDRHNGVHYGAFVGSHSDLRRNCDHVCDHFDLSDEDRQELAKAVLKDWIGADYR